MRALRLIAMLAGLMVSLACSDRSRLNPIDPENPRTKGKPTGLRVIADLDTIQLSWDALSLRDLSGYNIYRRLTHESGMYLIGQTSAQTTTFREHSNQFGAAHFYAITARIGAVETTPSEEVAVTPGPTVSWVADSDNRAVIKLTHDGRHEILRARAFINPFRLRVDSARRKIWVVDEFLGDFGAIDEKGNLLGKYGNFFDPVGLALNREDGSLWVGDNNESMLVHFDTNGAKIMSLDSLPRLGALAFHASLQELWALTSAGDLLLRVRSAAEVTPVNVQPTWEAPVTDLAIAGNTGEAWIAARNRVARVNRAGVVVFTSSEQFRFASRLALDQTTGACWVIDDSGESRNNSSVYKLNAHGEVQFKIDGLARPQGLAVNPFDGSCYVLDTLQGRLVSISSEGITAIGYTGFLTPFDIEVVMPER